MRLPLDKSLVKDMALIEIQQKGHKLRDFLDNYPEEEMGNDVRAVRDVLHFWPKERVIPVRNFRSLLIGLKVIDELWQTGKEFILGDQLKGRKLDPESSQWISAEILTHQRQAPTVPSYHVRLALSSWKLYDENNFNVYDKTLKKHFDYLIRKLQREDPELFIESAEDVPLGYAMGEIALEDAKEAFPSLEHHETNRFKELEYMMTNTHNSSKDHRMVMARAMKDVLDHGYADAVYKSAVNKSFPKFWEYLYEVKEMYRDHEV